MVLDGQRVQFYQDILCGNVTVVEFFTDLHQACYGTCVLGLIGWREIPGFISKVYHICLVPAAILCDFCNFWMHEVYLGLEVEKLIFSKLLTSSKECKILHQQ